MREKVIVVALPLQIVFVPLNNAVGLGFTIIVGLPEISDEVALQLLSDTLVN